jgi:hypothetical protein
LYAFPRPQKELQMKSLMLFVVVTAACCFAQDAPLTGDLYDCVSSKPLGITAVQNCNTNSLRKNSFYHLMTPDGHEYVFVRKFATDRMMGRVTYRLDEEKVTVYWYHAPDSGGLPYDHPLFTKTLIR